MVPECTDQVIVTLLQGLNFVAGTLLLFLDEEDAFWCLCAALGDILRGYYDVDMMGMQVRWSGAALRRG